MNGEWLDKARRAFCARPRSKLLRLCALEWARVYRLCDCSISYACARVFARARDTDRVCRKIRYERVCPFRSRIRMSVFLPLRTCERKMHGAGFVCRSPFVVEGSCESCVSCNLRAVAFYMASYVL